MNHNSKIIFSACLALFTSSCTSIAPEKSVDNDQKLSIAKSFLKGHNNDLDKSDKATSDRNKSQLQNRSGMAKLKSLPRDEVTFRTNKLSKQFSENSLVKVSANNMSVQDFIHYVYGELLGVNYVLTPEISAVNKPVTLNLQDKVSKRRLFVLADTILAERNLSLKYNENIYAISKVNPKSKSATVVGVGRSNRSIPTGNRKIMQVVPVLYGIKVNLKRTVEQLSNVAVTIDVKQSALFVTGNYADVSRALELIRLLDSPANRGRYIGVVKLTYTSINQYLEQISNLLTTEGVPNSINTPGNNNLVFVPLTQIGAVAVFAATKALYDRVEFWTKTLDKPSEGDVKQYFVFHPRYARAKDIGESLTPLINARTNVNNSSINSTAKKNSADSKSKNTGQLSSLNRKIGASNQDLSFVVDKRSNAIIFYSTGTNYRNIIPLIKRLDVLPKQVMLDIVVAEVKMIGDFRFGVEWAIKNGNFGISTQDAFGVSSGVGGLSLLSSNGLGDQIQAAFFKNNQNIDVLSNPSILVRDGVTANLDIGADISIVGATTIDNLTGQRQTTASSFRKTGIKVTVTPTINAQGVVIMEIEESISNTVPDSAGTGGNPNIFERNVNTEVVANSGQTIILAGLVAEDKSTGDVKVPGFGDLPLVGNLFKKKTTSSTKTELVLMITPKVISRSDQWNGIMSSFKQKFDNIQID